MKQKSKKVGNTGDSLPAGLSRDCGPAGHRLQPWAKEPCRPSKEPAPELMMKHRGFTGDDAVLLQVRERCDSSYSKSVIEGAVDGAAEYFVLKHFRGEISLTDLVDNITRIMSMARDSRRGLLCRSAQIAEQALLRSEGGTRSDDMTEMLAGIPSFLDSLRREKYRAHGKHRLEIEQDERLALMGVALSDPASDQAYLLSRRALMAGFQNGQDGVRGLLFFGFSLVLDCRGQTADAAAVRALAVISGIGSRESFTLDRRLWGFG